MWLFKKRIPAEHLATILFNKLVLEDEEVVLNKILDKKSGININTLSEQMFVYLVSLIAVALTTEAETQPAIIYTIKKFRQLTNQEMLKRWNTREEDADTIIESAGRDLSRLIFTNPKDQPALSLKWAQDWLGMVRTEEVNPATLFRLSFLWKNRYIHLMKFLRSFVIVFK